MGRSFNGTDQWLNPTPVPTITNVSAPFSIAAWVQYNTSATGPRIVVGITSGIGGTGTGIFLRVNDATTDTPEYAYFDGTTNHRAVGASTLSTNTWYQLTGTYDGTNYKIYTNGVVASTADAVGPNFPINGSGTGNFGIGAVPANTTPTHFWLGLIADVGIWNVALTAAEALALFRGARLYMIRERALLNYWPLDGLVSPEPDLSGSADNAAVGLGSTGTPPLAFGPPFTPFTPRWPQFLMPSPPVTTLMAQVQL